MTRPEHTLAWLALSCAIAAPWGSRAAPVECDANVRAPRAPDALERAVGRLNLLDRAADRSAFMARAEDVARARPADPLLALYSEHVALLPRLRYVEGRAELERNAKAIGALGKADRCRLRAVFEDPEAGVRIGAMLAYRPSAIERLAGKSPERVAEMITIFGLLGALYHQLGARRHFFDVSYHFVDVFEPIRRRLPPALEKQVGEVLDDLGDRRTELFADLPAGTRPMDD